MPKADIDFTDTNSGAGYLTPGVYRVKLQEVQEADGREYPLWVWIVASMEPESFGKTARHTTSLSPKAAYFIRQTIEAFGGEVPQSIARINTDDYLGRQAIALVVEDGTFTGKDGQEHPRYKVQQLMPVVGEDAPKPLQAAPADMRDVDFGGDDIPFD